MKTHSNKSGVWNFLPFLIVFSFFLFYSHPLWSNKPFHRSIIELDRIHHEEINDFLKGDQKKFVIVKYSIGAYFLDWLVADSLMNFGDTPGSKPEYAEKSGTVSAWYHCLLAALAALILFFIAKPYLGKKYALLAMIFYCANPAMPFFSLSAGVNMPFLFFGFSALLVFDHWRRGGAVYWMLLFGLLAACATMYKEFFIFMAAGAMLLLLIEKKGTRPFLFTKVGLVGTGIAAVAFGFAIYGLSFEWKQPGIFSEHISAYFANPGYTVDWQPQSILLFTIPYIFLVVFSAAQSIPAAFLTFAGLRRSVVRKKYRIWILFFPSLIYFLFVVVRFSKTVYPYLLPLLPFVAVSAAMGSRALIDFQSKKWNQKLAKFAALGLIAAAICTLLLQSLFLSYDFIHDTRVQVQSFTESLPSDPPVTIGSFEQDFTTSKAGVLYLAHNSITPLPEGDKLPDYILIGQRSVGDLLDLLKMKENSENIKILPDRYFGKNNFYSLYKTFKASREFYRKDWYNLNQTCYLFKRIGK